MHRQTAQKRTTHHLSLLVVLTAVIVACASACGGGGGESTNKASTQPRAESSDVAAEKDTSGHGGTLRIAMSAGNIPIPDQFVTEGGEGVRFVRVNVYDCLLNWDAGQGATPPDPIPGLASSWTRSDDNLTWTFALRQGVKFHDAKLAKTSFTPVRK
jgi:peptide/nickel transport system substrate-binding protein